MLGFRKLCLRLVALSFKLGAYDTQYMPSEIYFFGIFPHGYEDKLQSSADTANSAGLLFCQEASIYTGKLFNDTTCRHQWWILVDPFPPDMLLSAQEKPFHGEKTGDWYLFRWGWPQVTVPQETRQPLLLALHPSCASTAWPTPLYKPILPSVL